MKELKIKYQSEKYNGDRCVKLENALMMIGSHIHASMAVYGEINEYALKKIIDEVLESESIYSERLKGELEELRK